MSSGKTAAFDVMADLILLTKMCVSPGTKYKTHNELSSLQIDLLLHVQHH